MFIFYLVLVITYITAYFSNILKVRKNRVLLAMFFLVTTTILILVSGLRKGIGDTYFYRHAYNLLVQDVLSGRFELEFNGEFGFVLFQLILILISQNSQILVFVTALITNGLNSLNFYKYSNVLHLTFYMYITSGYFTTTMNGIRQSLVAACIFSCTHLIIRGRFKLFLIITLFLSTIHTSALIMIPLYFLVRQPVWSKQIMRLIGLAIIGVFLYDVVESVIFNVLENTTYGHYVNFNEGGSTLLRSVVNMVPLFLAYIKRDELKKHWPESDIFVNFSLVNVVFVTFGMFNWIFNRFTIYFQLYNFILLPFIINKCFKGKEQRLLYVGFIICYFIFFYYEHVMQLGMNYYSEYLNFENIFYNILP